MEASHTKQAVFRAWSFATGKRNRADAASLTLTASLPFSTWDRLVRSYLDRGIVPSEQVEYGRVGWGRVEWGRVGWSRVG